MIKNILDVHGYRLPCMANMIHGLLFIIDSRILLLYLTSSSTFCFLYANFEQSKQMVSS